MRTCEHANMRQLHSTVTHYDGLSRRRYDEQCTSYVDDAIDDRFARMGSIRSVLRLKISLRVIPVIHWLCEDGKTRARVCVCVCVYARARARACTRCTLAKCSRELRRVASWIPLCDAAKVSRKELADNKVHKNRETKGIVSNDRLKLAHVSTLLHLTDNRSWQN